MNTSKLDRNDLLFLLKLFAAAGLIFACVAIGMELFKLSQSYQLTLWLCMIPVLLLALLIPLLFIRKKLPLLVAWLILSGITAVPLSLALYSEYEDSLTIDTGKPLDLEEYLPFQTGDVYYMNIWRLGFWDDYSPVEITLTDELPVLDGANLAFPIYSAIVNALYPETTQLDGPYFRCSGHTDGFTSLINGTADIFFGSKPTQAQLAYAQEQGVALVYTPVADTYLRFLIHPDNPVRSLSTEEVKGIFSGAITNWKQVGGNDEEILVYQNEAGSDVQQALESFMGETPLMEPMTRDAFDFTKGFHQQIALYKNESNAIGVILGHTYGDLIAQVRPYTLAINDTDLLYSHNPVTIYAVTRKDCTNENVQKVVDWIISPQGQYAMLWTGFDPYYYDDFTSTDDLTVNTAPNIVLDDYMPFRQDTKIVRLDHEASLKLEGLLPRIDGAAAVFPVYSAFVDAVYPNIRLYNNDQRDLEDLPDIYFFNYSNTVKGYRYLAQKDTDIFFGGYPSDEQIAYAAEHGTEFVYTPIGYDAFVFFVHKDNPIDSLTTEQIRKIYSGEITNWSQVGGLDEEIVAYQRNPGSGSQSRLIRFMDGVPLMDAPTDTRIDTMMGITQSVASYRSTTASIGFSFRYYMEVLVANPDIKLLAVDGIAPTAENIQNGTYPETGYLYAVSWAGNNNENVQKLLDWVLSPEGQYIIQQTGYIPIGPTE